MLGANSLGGVNRSPGYGCGNWQLGAFTQDCAPSRRAETGPGNSYNGVVPGLDLLYPSGYVEP